MSDTSRHLIYFKVENFKRFESFEMKDLGQFNLIVGDNNVGKTSVLEALLVDEDGYETVGRLAKVLLSKKIKPEFSYMDLFLFHNRNIPSKKERKILFIQGFNQTQYQQLTMSLDLFSAQFKIVLDDGRKIESRGTEIIKLNHQNQETKPNRVNYLNKDLWNLDSEFLNPLYDFHKPYFAPE